LSATHYAVVGVALDLVVEVTLVTTRKERRRLERSSMGFG